MGYKKILEKLFRKPTAMRIHEIITLLSHLNYSLDRIRGSHFIFTKPGKSDIVIPSHQNKVKRVYLKELKDTLILEMYDQQLNNQN